MKGILHCELIDYDKKTKIPVLKYKKFDKRGECFVLRLEHSPYGQHPLVYDFCNHLDGTYFQYDSILCCAYEDKEEYDKNIDGNNPDKPIGIFGEWIITENRYNYLLEDLIDLVNKESKKIYFNHNGLNFRDYGIEKLNDMTVSIKKDYYKTDFEVMVDELMYVI